MRQRQIQMTNENREHGTFREVKSLDGNNREKEET